MTKTIQTALQFKDVNQQEALALIEHWRKLTDLPVHKIEIEKIGIDALSLQANYSLDIFDHSVTQFISILFAEIPLVKPFGKVTFMDLQLPEEVYSWFQGPKFGAEGVAKRFKVKQYPLLLGIAKPSLGLSLESIEEKINQITAGGFQVLKDDETVGDVTHASLKQRLKLAQKYPKYVPMLNLDSPEAYSGIPAEISMIMINASVNGFPAVIILAVILPCPFARICPCRELMLLTFLLGCLLNCIGCLAAMLLLFPRED